MRDPRFHLLLILALLASLAQAATFHVDDYGAQPDNPGFNSAQAFSSAIFAASVAGPGSEVVLGPGSYYLRSSVDGQPFLTITNAQGLTIRGQGRGVTRVINTRPKGGGFQFMQGRDITVRDFSYDHDPLPFTQGVVTARSRNSNYIDVRIDAGFPVPTDAWYTDANLMDANYTRWGMVFNATTRRMEPDAPDFIFLTGTPQDRGGGVYRFNTIDSTERNKINQIDVGDLFAVVIRPVIGGPFFFFQTERATLQDVDIHSSASLAVTSFGATETTIRGSAVRMPAGSTRLVSTSGDGWHFQQDRVGPLIEDTYLEGMADDGIAINCFPNVVGRQDSARVIVVDSGTILQAGDDVTLYNPRDGQVLLETTIAALGTTGALPGMPTSFAYVVTLAADAPSLVISATRTDSDQLFNVSASGRDYIARRNVINHHRGRSIFVQSPRGLIEDNQLTRSGGFSIVVANEPFWPLGPLPSDTIIRGNTITHGVENTFWFAGTSLAGAIQVRGSRGNNLVANNRVLSRVEISNNTIIDPPATAIHVGATGDVLLYGNLITSTGTRVPPKSDEAIVLDRVAGAVLVDNTIVDTPLAPLFRGGVRLTSTTENGCEGFSLINLQTTLAAGRLAIRDDRTVPGNYVCGNSFLDFPVSIHGVGLEEREAVVAGLPFEVDVTFPAGVFVPNLPAPALARTNLTVQSITPIAQGFRVALVAPAEGTATVSVPAGILVEATGRPNAASREFRVVAGPDPRSPTAWRLVGQ